jgi:hypothetical protein
MLRVKENYAHDAQRINGRAFWFWKGKGRRGSATRPCVGMDLCSLPFFEKYSLLIPLKLEIAINSAPSTAT